MVLMGLWHGAAWTFVLWGLFHGTMLVAWDVFRLPRRFRKVVIRPVRIAFYFQITALSLLIFRASSVHQIGEFLHLLLWNGSDPDRLDIFTPPLSTMIGIPLFLAFDFLAFHHSSDLFYRKWPAAARGSLVAILFILVLMGWSNAPAEFIYFQF
jgi:alginate O-acetyltransferase complex protein AlgI